MFEMQKMINKIVGVLLFLVLVCVFENKTKNKNKKLLIIIQTKVNEN